MKRVLYYISIILFSLVSSFRPFDTIITDWAVRYANRTVLVINAISPGILMGIFLLIIFFLYHKFNHTFLPIILYAISVAIIGGTWTVYHPVGAIDDSIKSFALLLYIGLLISSIFSYYKSKKI